MRLDQMKFRMRVRSQFRTPLERQLGEQKTGTYLMNSNVKYNRCTTKRSRPKSYNNKKTENDMRKLSIEISNESYCKLS